MLLLLTMQRFASKKVCPSMVTFLHKNTSQKEHKQSANNKSQPAARELENHPSISSQYGLLRGSLTFDTNLTHPPLPHTGLVALCIISPTTSTLSWTCDIWPMILYQILQSMLWSCKKSHLDCYHTWPLRHKHACWVVLQSLGHDL